MSTNDKPDPDVLIEFSRTLHRNFIGAGERFSQPEYESLLIDCMKVTQYRSFIVGSQVYYPGQVVIPLSRCRPTSPILPKEFMPRFHAWQRSHNLVKSEMACVRQTLDSLFLQAKSWQQVRNMLPEHVIKPLLHRPELASLQRTSLDLYAGPPLAFDEAPTQARLSREAIWDPRLINMYGRVGEIIDVYLGYALL